MAENIQKGIISGLIVGVVMLLLALVGFVNTSAQIISGLMGKTVENGTPASLLVFLAIVSFFGGMFAIRAPHHIAKSWAFVVVRSALSGLASGLIVGVFTWIIGTELASKVEMRAYLNALSPDNVRVMTVDQPALLAGLTIFGLLTAVSLASGVLWHLVTLAGIGRLITGVWTDTVSEVTSNPGVQRVASSKTTRYLVYAALILTLFVLPRTFNNFIIHTLGTVGIYVLIGLGLNIVVGLAGLLDLGYVAFFAVGSFVMALLTAPFPHNLLWSFWPVVPICIGVAGAIGVLLGVPVLRLRGDYLAIVTLGFGEIIRILIKSDDMAWLTNGPKGVTNVGQPILFGQKFNSELDFFYMIVLGAMAVIFVTNRLEHSRVGRSWIAIREDETVARAMGINTWFYKLLAFGIGAAFAGLGGALVASRSLFVGPEDYTLLVSINVLALVIVGGMGSIPGVILGAFVLKGIPELLRDLDQYRVLFFGILLVVMMILRPQGIWPAQRRRLEMARDDEPVDLTQSAEGAAK